MLFYINLFSMFSLLKKNLSTIFLTLKIVLITNYLFPPPNSSLMCSILNWCCHILAPHNLMCCCSCDHASRAVTYMKTRNTHILSISRSRTHSAFTLSLGYFSLSLSAAGYFYGVIYNFGRGTAAACSRAHPQMNREQQKSSGKLTNTFFTLLTPKITRARKERES